MVKNKSATFQTKNVLMLSCGHFIQDAFAFFLAPFLPLIISKFGLSMVLAGFLTVALRLPALLGPVFGYISDFVDVRIMVIVTPAATAVAMSLLGVAPNYAIVCLLLGLAGISSTLFHTIGPVMVAHVSGNDLGRGMSYWMTGAELARTIAPLIAVSVVSILGFEGSYPVMLIGIFASLLLYINLKDLQLPSSRKNARSMGKIWHMLRRIMVPLITLLFCRAFLITSFTAFLPTYMISLGKTLWLGGVMLALFELAGIAGALFGGTISDRIGRRIILKVTIPLSSILMLTFIYFSGWVKFPMVMLLGVTASSIMPVNMAILYDFCGKNRGVANGFFMTVNFASTAIVTLFVGWLADLTGFRMAFTVNAILGFLCVAAVFLLPAIRKKVDE